MSPLVKDALLVDSDLFTENDEVITSNVALRAPRPCQPRKPLRRENIQVREENRKGDANIRRRKQEHIVVSSDSEADEQEINVILGIEKVDRPSLTEELETDAEEGRSLFNHRGAKASTNARYYHRARRVIESSDSEDSEVVPPKSRTKEVEVIELTSSSESESEKDDQNRELTNKPTRLELSLPPYLAREDDGAILVFEEPRSARKPMRITSPKLPTLSKRIPCINQSNDGKRATASDGASTSGPVPRTPLTRVESRAKAKFTPRLTKKAIEAAEQNRREKYAQDLFNELNETVFKNGLPHDTKLNWSKRLLTTAGRARYHRSRDGVVTSEIELAIKILDCDERIRNTLSHEMCHLATWMIDGKLKENHGKWFKHWAAEIIKKRPDIEITTRHSYEISYPYRWECQKCSKIYGRFSKSIRPDECVCGSCKEGQLRPLFSVRATGRTQTPKVSQMAAGKAQDSPRSLPRSSKATKDLAVTDNAYLPDIDADIEALTLTMQDTRLA